MYLSVRDRKASRCLQSRQDIGVSFNRTDTSNRGISLPVIKHFAPNTSSFIEPVMDLFSAFENETESRPGSTSFLNTCSNPSICKNPRSSILRRRRKVLSLVTPLPGMTTEYRVGVLVTRIYCRRSTVKRCADQSAKGSESGGSASGGMTLIFLPSFAVNRIIMDCPFDEVT